MTAHDLPPGRLLDTQSTPHALRDALQALRERAPSAAAAARIEQRLGRSPQPGQATSRVPQSLIAIGLLASFGALGVWAWPEHQAIRLPRSASPSEAPALPLPAAIERPAQPAHEPRLPAANTELTAPPSLNVPLPLPLPLPAPALATSSRAPKRKNALAPTAQPAALAAQPTAITAPAPPEVPARSLTAPPEDAERVFADPQDEAGLLYRARRLSSSDPNAALRLLVLHEASFPDGAFVQERDMLEIQIHERLGHAATAKRLAALFKQRYPASVYRVSP